METDKRPADVKDKASEISTISKRRKQDKMQEDFSGKVATVIPQQEATAQVILTLNLSFG